ncbi:MAG: D-amino acid dehydrogenase [Rhodovarius sp.]|nr:D-amino acid dehydrogenase [Rhodovarius sp.]MCX8132588.1 D-amino acid dehydrogenase [Roseococcus sp.]MDW8314634.1 D-amino acid dehydrogenase [Rhodovarius sp.]
MRVCVLGAGVVGLASAYLLAREGHAVTVLDAEAGPGRMTSYANGAQLSYAYVAPFAAPGLLRKLPGWLADRDGPLRLRPELSWHQLRWLWRFWRACNAAQVERTTAALLALGALSRELTREVTAREALDYAFARAGKLVVYRDAAALREAAAQVALQRRLGVEQEVLDRAGCLAVEPALAGMAERIAGGVWTPGEDAGDCHLFCEGLVAVLQRSNFRVSFRFGTRVTQLLSAGGRVIGAATPHGVEEAEAFVLALGNGARALAAPLGLDLPIAPLKGYSLTVPVTGPAPQVSVTDAAAKVVYARLRDRLRIAGMADLVGADHRFDNRRLDSLLRLARRAFPEASDWRELKPWVGLRPATPTGLPLIGRAPGWPNLYLNVGQGALGFTLAMGSAALLADAMAERRPPIDAAAFAPRC